MKGFVKRFARICGLEPVLTRASRWNWLRKVGGTRTLSSGVTCQLKTYDDWLIFHEIFELKAYDAAFDALLDGIPSGGQAKVLDLGGNVGFFALGLLHFWIQRKRDTEGLHIVSVEAIRQNCERMKAHRDLHRAFGMRWEIIHGLAGERQGSALIGTSEGHYSFRVGIKNVGKMFRVDYVDLSQLVRGWERIALLKCDIEGSEVNVLKNYPEILSGTDIVCIEVHGVSAFEPVDSALADAGFDARCVLGAEGTGGPSGATRTILLTRSAGITGQTDRGVEDR